MGPGACLLLTDLGTAEPLLHHRTSAGSCWGLKDGRLRCGERRGWGGGSLADPPSGFKEGWTFVQFSPLLEFM